MLVAGHGLEMLVGSADLKNKIVISLGLFLFLSHLPHAVLTHYRRDRLERATDLLLTPHS